MKRKINKMIKFFKDLIYDGYVFCSWNKHIHLFILQKFKLIRVGNFILNLNKPHTIQNNVGKYWILKFESSEALFYLDKKEYKITQK